MTPDDMARELRAAGWIPMKRGFWCDPPRGVRMRAAEALRELARQRETGTVNPPVVGEESK
jgi:hypothetical protein